ncbi:MOSC and FAD-binding oxidoreductase domain-containing protein [Streptomyces liangshanensis]|uniref:MOSC domain-containing protein n=1 Tax=Streptomyces liangshanensis TaxID=2717324 RepID=A0A6G9H0T3_9ACTN|nr:MOSC and FAD-binding oxidoreductase domain-containing protein [Streptomyces liangshanensis]QIQ04152.1 MOSC domain-containing protein [Streptomyces liangshanensis]
MATLTSLNVGMPQDVPWHGRTVHTGVWKYPVDGPRTARRLNIDGDGQGDLEGHGGEHRAVLVYQTDSYRHWEEHLSRDRIEPGQFGENLTVDGLPDDEVCIGDRYRIGGAVFEVSQPRVTCYRVGLRMEEPRMAALLVSHRRPGFYMRVIVEGDVAAGQEIVKVADGPEGMTVADIDALLYLPGHPRDDLDRALRIRALSPGWQASLRSLKEQAAKEAAGEVPAGASGNTGLTTAASSPPPAWTGFRPLRVDAVREESHSVFSLTLSATDGSRLPAWLPGQSVTLRLRPEGTDTPLIRSYSLSNDPGDGRYRISVKQEPHGAASTLIHTKVRVGDTLDVAAPRGTFFLNDSDRPVVLASAGVGATPVLAMLHALADTGGDVDRSTGTGGGPGTGAGSGPVTGTPREVWWLHGARERAEHPFAAESRALLDMLPASHRYICYSHPAAGDRQGVDYTATGHLSADAIHSSGLPADADAYLCGPTGFMDDLTAALAGYGMAPDRIHVETFGAGAALNPGVLPSAAHAPHAPAEAPASPGPDVSFSRSGLTVPWDPRYASLLELAEACDVPTRWSCRTGVCHNCESALLSGDVTYDPDPVEPPAEGDVLICCSRPRDGIVLDL